MKTLAFYAMVLGLSVTGLNVSDTTHQKRPSFYASLESIELETPSELLASFELPGLSETPAVVANKKKAYHIYFENKSTQPIEVAIRFKDDQGEWQLDGLTELSPGEKKKMGESFDKTYYYYASNLNLEASRDQTFKFPIKHKSRKKLKFLKEEIWECYNTEMCNSFAVFR